MARDISRREFMKTAGASTAAASVIGGAVANALAQDSATTAAPSGNSSSGKKPNIVLIVLDDLGSIDARCYGADDLLTPNLDALAGAGVRLTQFYGAGPICSPSRAAVMTGRYPLHVGIEGNIPSLPGSAGLSRDQIILPEWLKANGYATGLVGKWHLGYRAGEMPGDRGFDSSFGNMGGCIDNYSHYYFWQGPDRHDLWQDGVETWRAGEYYAEMMVERCHAFFDKSKDAPFFLYLAINQPHYPLQGITKWREYYSKLPEPRNMYAASVSTLDEIIGRILTRLRELGLSQNTIVILQSDHGHSTEDRAFGGGGNAGPYRGAKYSLFEGGIRIVSMISWPGFLPAGAVRDQLAAGCDWFPTIAELCRSSFRIVISTAEASCPCCVPRMRLQLTPCFIGSPGRNGPFARAIGSWLAIRWIRAIKRADHPRRQVVSQRYVQGRDRDAQPGRCASRSREEPLRPARSMVDRRARSVINLHRHGHRLHLRVISQGIFAQFPADAGHLEAAERGGGVEDVVAVDPDRAGPQFGGQAVGLADVARPDGGGQAVDASGCRARSPRRCP